MAVQSVDGQTLDTRRLLAHAAEAGRRRGFDRFPIVDVDAHHYESESWPQITRHIENPVIRMRSEVAGTRVGGNGMMPQQLGNQDMSGRITRYHLRRTERVEPGLPRDVALIHRSMDQMGVDYSCVFPTPMLNLGMHPEVDIEVAVARAYARWMTEEVLPASDRIKCMLYLPFNDPEASVRLIDEFAGKPGIVGFMVTSVRNAPVHHNRYARIYRALEERDMPLAFHSAFNWWEESMRQFNRFISVHAIGFTLYNIVHLTNWVINGIPERFPRLKVIWIESGIAWIPFLMQRLDNEFMMRSSEAPLLKRKPSEYMREFYFSTQPMEREGNTEALRIAFEMMHAETQLLYASDYPHWDFDLPSRVYDLPFLSEEAKRRILGRNAIDLLKLPVPAAYAAEAR